MLRCSGQPAIGHWAAGTEELPELPELKHSLAIDEMTSDDSWHSSAQ